MSNTAPRPKSPRTTLDTRSLSQLAYLQSVYAVAFGVEPVTPSVIIRRAVALLTDHVGNILQAGHLDGRHDPHGQDADAEAAALVDHAHMVDADMPMCFVERANGRLRTWDETMGLDDLGLAGGH